jgi:hypothetical protein
MSNWEDALDKTKGRQDGERPQYSILLSDIAKTEFYKLSTTLKAKAKEVSDRYKGQIREIQVSQTEGVTIQIDQDDWLRFHIRLDLAKSGRRITINGHSTNPASECRYLKPVVLKLGVDSKNHLHIQRDGRDITVEDIAKMIFVAILTGSDFQ